ncbi:L-threonylcarbamoyladenylate synthase [Flavobacterium sp.]|uniref:L-threonylcarbamoyladenylate synthase n=1 Tax=Flavobacterium sp. TaxID=239 RepID=UPI0025D8D78A|nr:L-threonylcarbamoyladenylate synthase [Flavobacterium sp.]
MDLEILKAAALLQQGKVVAIPTETVYGLAANAFDENAVSQIFEIKQRPRFNPLIIHIKSVDDLQKVATKIPAKAMILARHFWPGALTLVLPKKDIVPNSVTAGKNTVGVRVPSHPVTLKLLEQLDFPLAAPSANLFGYISPTCVAHVQKQLGDKIPYILEGGNCEKGIESTIIGFENNEPMLYRVGAISKEEIENLIGKIKQKTRATATPDAPGMLTKHYSPSTKFIVSNNISADIEKCKNQAVGFLVFSNINYEKSQKIIQLTITENLNEAAQNLYAAMHHLDAAGFDLIIAEKFPEKGVGISLNDRLYRAQEENFDPETQNEIRKINS